jgi:predicted nucleic acid-binding protein
MMEITRDVVLDLMPLYVAGEVSEATRKLVEAYLENDEDLKRLAECAEKTGLKEVPMTEQKELSLEAYEKANKMMVIRTLGLAAIIAATVVSILLIVPLILIFVF